MALPNYADVQWIQWLRKIGAIEAIREDRLIGVDVRPFDRRSTSGNAEFIMDRCVQVPAAYWPQIVDEGCARLIEAGVDGETVKKVRCWLENELKLRP